MKLHDFMKKYYPKETKWLKESYPNMTRTAKEIDIIEWQDEWAVADKNPEFIDTLQVLDLMLDSGIISEEEYRKEINKMRPTYASKTLAAAFIKEKKVSFRQHPNIKTIIHELGHIHFQALELEWNSAYGGGENLIYITYSGKGKFTEEDIENYMKVYRKIYKAPLEKIDQITWAIGRKINEGLKEIGFNDMPIHPVSLSLMAGTIPSVKTTTKEEQSLLFNTFDGKQLDEYIKSGRIKFETLSLKSALLTFISAYIQDGFIYNDPFLTNYGQAFFKKLKEIETLILVHQQLDCSRIIIVTGFGCIYSNCRNFFTIIFVY